MASTFEDFEALDVPADGFAVWFLGQNSFLLKSPEGTTIAIDPYLSDWCATRGKSRKPTSRSRLFPPPIDPEDLDVDWVLLTHSHCDHADPETLSRMPRKALRIVAPADAARIAAEAGIPEERIYRIHPGEELPLVKERGVLARAARIRSGSSNESPAGHPLSARATFALPTDGSDLNHIGFLIRFPSGASFWDTGDSAWSDTLPTLATAGLREGLPEGASGPDLMAVCINAGYGNLSHWEASRLVGAATPSYAIPTHWDLFPHNRCDPEPFRTSLDKNARGTEYAKLEKDRFYVFSAGRLKPL